MTEHGDPAGEEFDGVDWRELGTFAPRVPPGRRGPRRDLGPGGSVRQDARRARRLRLASRPWARRPAALASAAVAAVVLGVVLAVFGGLLGVVAGVVVVAAAVAAGVLVVRDLLEQTASERRSLLWARHERQVARELDALRASGWVVLHDRLLPGGEHRVTHIAVGPAGVFVVTPLPETGALRIVGGVDADGDWRQLYAGSLHMGTWLATRRWEVAELERAVADAYADVVWSGPTAAVAVEVPTDRWWRWRRPVDDAVPELPSEWQGVLIRPLAAVVETLRGLPSPLSRAAVASLAATVEELCSPAGRPDETDQSTSNNPS